MILEGFRKVNIRKKTVKELLKSNSVKSDIINRIDSVLILVDDNSKENLNQIISKKLNIDVSKVATILFRTKQESDTSYEYELTEKDFSLLGKLKNEVIEKLIKSDFDLLLNYTNDNLYLNYLTAFSNAKFKVGLDSNKNEFLDLMINIGEENVDLFHNELVKYLKILNKI
ncbi:MAG: hypothetical protein PSN34_07575 [Urechidicola sp.]|nr:hypothetical protein [Urechidicola sp.]